MKRIKFTLLIIVLLFTVAACNSKPSTNTQNKTSNNKAQIDVNTKLPATVSSYVENFLAEENTIPAERKEQLKEIAGYINKKVDANAPVNLTFICTHNSRRSHMSQIWAQSAAVYYNIPNVYCFSGGTEATAFNPRSVRALRTAGFEIKQLDQSKNPIYNVYFDTDNNFLKGFSKKFSDDSNPQDNFVAIMTCSHADQVCPLVPGATARFAIPYLDPKVADNTPNEENKYNERCKQIASEMFYLLSKVKS
jgi:arsenate reductase